MKASELLSTTEKLNEYKTAISFLAAAQAHGIHVGYITQNMFLPHPVTHTLPRFPTDRLYSLCKEHIANLKTELEALGVSLDE